MCIKDTKGKLKLNLVPDFGLEAVARVREFGNKKYPGPPNEYITKVPVEDLVEACRRHLLKHRKGELLDDESLEMHLAHVATSAMMALEIIYRDIYVNDITLRGASSIHRGIYEANAGRTVKLTIKDFE